MKLTNILDYWLAGDIIHEAKEDTRPGDVYVNKRNGNDHTFKFQKSLCSF